MKNNTSTSNFEIYSKEISELGYVIEVNEKLVKVEGLPGAFVGEVVHFEVGGEGIVFTLLENTIEVLLLTNDYLEIGESVVRSGKTIEINNYKEFQSLKLNGIGQTDDAKASVQGSIPVFRRAPGIALRAPINKPLETGFQIIDLVVPLGKGQRELVLGDRKTGKTQVLLDIVAHQAKMGTFIVYALVGKQSAEIENMESLLTKLGVRDRVCIVASRSNDPIGQIYLTPYSAMSVAEEMLKRGLDVVVVMDDMSTHAQFYREISLMARRFPGRSSYPGNIFYIHSSLMERSGNFIVGNRELSITCFPVAQSNLGDISSYITTNLMSMTDGHLYLDSEIFDKGRRPSVNVFTSVTRVGHQTQTPLHKDVSREISSFLVQHERALEYSHFGNEISIELQKVIERGKVLYAIFDQKQHVSVPINIGLYFVANLWGGKITNTSSEYIKSTVEKVTAKYYSDQQFSSMVNSAVAGSASLRELVTKIPYVELQ